MPTEAVYFEKERGVTQISVTPGIVHATVTFNVGSVAEQQLHLLQQLAEAQIPVFLIKLLSNGMSFAFRDNVAEAGARLLQESGVSHILRTELCLMTIYAGAMRDLSGVMASLYETLINEGVTVRQTGDTHNAVYCLLDGGCAMVAENALRRTFSLRFREDTQTGNPATAEAPERIGAHVL